MQPPDEILSRNDPKEREEFSGRDLSIECAKAYTDNSGDTASLNALKSKIGELGIAGKTHSLVLLVDDISYPDKSFDFDEYADWLASAGFYNANIYRESQITESCDKVKDMIDLSKLSPEVSDLMQQEAYPSQLFIASWFLLRLGQIESHNFPASLRAARLFNIVPESFKLGEDQALEIVRASPFAEAVNNIEYQFISE